MEDSLEEQYNQHSLIHKWTSQHTKIAVKKQPPNLSGLTQQKFISHSCKDHVDVLG